MATSKAVKAIRVAQVQETPGLDLSILKTFFMFIGVFLLSAIVLIVIRKLIFTAFDKWAEKTDTKVDDIIIDGLRYPSLYWLLAAAIYLGAVFSEIPTGYADYGMTALYVLVILSITFTAANIGARLVQNAIESRAGGVPATGISRAVTKVIIFAIGLIVIFHGLGVSITPLLTALGVGGLAVALGLQDSLSNLFAGIHILVERPIGIGDHIKLQTGEEGFVTDIGWRTSRLRDSSNNIIVIPNNTISKSTITNYSLPDKKSAVTVNVSVGWEADIDRVEAILIEVAQASANDVRGLLREPRPQVILSDVSGESAMNFALACHVYDYAARGQIQHELRKRIYKRLKAEGIPMPIPARAVYIKEERKHTGV